MTKVLSSMVIFAVLFAVVRSTARADQTATHSVHSAYIESSSLRIEFDRNMRSRVIARFNGNEVPIGAFSASETVKGSERSWYNFALASQTPERITDIYGAGERLSLTGTSGGLRKNVSITIYDNFPNLAVFDVSYTNVGKSPLTILEWSNNRYTIDAQRVSSQAPFWSFQSGSYERRPNWLVPLHTGFSQQNYLGMNASDYGGGTPIVDVWRKDVGMAVGHVEPRPVLISLPVSMPDARHARVAVRSTRERTLESGESFKTLRTFVSVHQGDYFRTLTEYRRLMVRQGFQMASAPDSAFGPIWCAWGYGRSVQLKQVFDTLPTVKKMGFSWVT